MSEIALMEHLRGSHVTELDLQRQGAAFFNVARVIAQLTQVAHDPTSDPGVIGFLAFTFPVDGAADEYKQDLNDLTPEEQVALLPVYRMMGEKIRRQFFTARDKHIEAVVALKQVSDPLALSQPASQPPVMYPESPAPQAAQTMVPPPNA